MKAMRPYLGDAEVMFRGSAVPVPQATGGRRWRSGRQTWSVRSSSIRPIPPLSRRRQAGRALVERRLCACVNILPGMISHYRWQDEIERAEEVVMIVKTRASLVEGVRAAVKDMHSYSTPAFLVIPVESVDPAYLGVADGGDGAGGAARLT